MASLGHDGGIEGAKRRRRLGLLCMAVAAALLLVVAVPRTAGRSIDPHALALVQAEQIAAALRRFRADLGCWPTRNRFGMQDHNVYALRTGPALVPADLFGGEHPFGLWGLSPHHGDRLDHHLRDNAPFGLLAAAYPTRGPRCWRGPYLPEPSPLDPWGRPFVVNVIGGFGDGDGEQYRCVLVLSAGPNGRFDTGHLAGTGALPGGDDVGVVVFRR